MNEKILTADLVNAVAELTDIPKNRCDDFVKAFFEAIANALAIDGIVKVKGLGTFKLIVVEERKSVNVQNGAEMIIPAHAKVSFTPDKTLKDEINKPYAHLKTYVLNPNAPLDPPDPDDDEAIDDTVSDAGVMDDDAVAESATSVPPVDEAVAQAVSESLSLTETHITAETAKQTEAVPPVCEAIAQAVSESLSQTETHITADGVQVPEKNVAPSVEVPVESVVVDAATPTETAAVEPEKEEISEEANTAKSVSSHSDWFDNWEVEYEGEDVEDPNALLADKKVETPVYVQPPVSVVDEVSASIEADVREPAVPADEPEQVAEVQAESEPVAEVKEESAVAAELEDGENRAEAVVADDAPACGNESDEAAGVDGLNEAEAAAVSGTESETEPVKDDKAPIEGKPVATEQVVFPTANDLANEPEEEVQHGKVLGVAIVTFVVLLIAAFFGLNHLDPDFFKGLKASSDNPPVMPSDTTSLAQELSVYVPEADSVDSPDASDGTEEAPYVDDSQSAASETVVAPQASNTVDPLWNGEFVAYMKRQHKDVSLATSGLIGETTIKPGLFLTMVALQNYGDKSYWIYLYLYNTDRIKNPNNVPVGTKIRVPNLDESLVNGPNEEQVNLAKEIRQKFAK